MNFWPWRRRTPRPSADANAALHQAERALMDAERLDSAAQDVAERLRATSARNHFREAVEDAMRRAVRKA